MALGSTIGSAVGGVGGAVIGGPLGAQIGGSLGGIVGGAIDLAGQETPNVPRIDPNEIARLREIQDTKRQISEGRDPLTQQRISDIQKQGQTVKGELGKFTGGDVGGTISAMLRAQRNTQSGINQAFTQSQQRLPFFENLQSQLENRISQRKLELDVNAQDRALAERANTQRQIIGNVAGGIGSIAGGISGEGLSPIGSQASLSGQNPIVTGGGGINSLGQFTSPSQLPVITVPNQQGFGGLQQGGFGLLGMGGF